MGSPLRSRFHSGLVWVTLLLVTSADFVTYSVSAADTAAASPSGSTVIQDQDGGEPEIPPGAGRIIGSPDPGPDPEHPGDRGGWAQLLTLGATVGGVGFIMWRITISARRTRRSTATDP